MKTNQRNFRTPRPFVFRCFSRHGYALFRCLGREVNVGVLSVATLLSAAPRLAQAAGTLTTATPDTEVAPTDSLGQEARSDNAAAWLSEACVTASRAPLRSEVAARQVRTLGKEELEAAGVTCVADVLKMAAAVDVRQRGGFGIQTDISVSGGTFDQITLLVNGIPVTNPQTGHNAADFPLNLSDIERIEVLEGAAARVFGSQAFAGAINVVTRSDAAPSLDVQAEAGSFGTIRADVRGALGKRGWRSSLSLSGQRSDGVVENGDYAGTKAFWQGGYHTDRLKVDAQAGVTVTDFGANTFYSGAYPNQWEATRRYLMAVQAETAAGPLHLRPTASWLRSVDHYQLIRDTQTGENFHRGDVTTLGLGAWTDWTAGRTAFGAEMREEAIYSSNLGRPLDSLKYVPIRGESGHWYDHHDRRTNVSYYLEHNIVLLQWTISAGVMAQHNSSLASGYRFYPGVDVSFRPRGGWKIFASCNRSLRLPTFTDLYYKSPTQEGNIGLKPEENTTVRIGSDLNRRGWSLSASAYYTRGTQMIDWVMYDANDIYHSTAFDLDKYGAGLRAEVDFPTLLGKPKCPLTKLRVDYAFVYQDRQNDGRPIFKSNYALEYLRHKLTASLAHRLPLGLEAQWSFRLQEREGNYLVYANATSTGELHPYGTNACLDLKITWKQPKWEVYADLSNLTAHRYCDIANVRLPGFLAMGGIRLHLQ